MFQSGYAFLLDLLLQFCKVESAILETSVPNHTNASSSMQVFQSTAACPAEGFATSPFGGGTGHRCGFCLRGLRQCRGSRGCVGRGIDSVRDGVVGGYWQGIHRCSLVD